MIAASKYLQQSGHGLPASVIVLVTNSDGRNGSAYVTPGDDGPVTEESLREFLVDLLYHARAVGNACGVEISLVPITPGQG